MTLRTFAPLASALASALLFALPTAAQTMRSADILEQLNRPYAGASRGTPTDGDGAGLQSRGMRNLTVSATAPPPLPSGDPLKRLCEPRTSGAAPARGIGDGADDAGAAGLRNLVVKPSSSVDLKVEFDFARATLRPEGVAQLDQLAAALGDPALASTRFVVAGHTDGVGSADANDRLSCARALAAKRYLVEQRRIDGSRLLTLGWGASRLLNSGNPAAAENRRVEIKRLDPG